jgi:hypothetical protein
MSLTRGNRRFFELLRILNVDDIISNKRLLEATGWTAISLKTYIKKNKLSPFLIPIPGGDFRVVRAGPALAEQESRLRIDASEPIDAGSRRRTGNSAHCGPTIGWCERLVVALLDMFGKLPTPGIRRGLLLSRCEIPDQPTRIPNVRQRFRREVRGSAARLASCPRSDVALVPEHRFDAQGTQSVSRAV